jgi:NAD(P)-dependent dehydrogenase (short-subunit alcohol dehydrogenase family)
LARDLSAAGAVVYGIDLRADAISGDGVTPIALDLADHRAYAARLVELEAEVGRIDVLANVAGIDVPVSALEPPGEAYERVLAIDFWAPMAGTLAVLPGMVDRGHGVVVNVASDSVRVPVSGIAAYAAAKGALAAFTESVAHEVRRHGVGVKVLYPGFVDTPMGQAALASGLPRPPKASRRTADQVAAVTLRRLDKPGVEINAVKRPAITPLLRTFAPRLHLRLIEGRGRA